MYCIQYDVCMHAAALGRVLIIIIITKINLASNSFAWNLQFPYGEYHKYPDIFF